MTKPNLKLVADSAATSEPSQKNLDMDSDSPGSNASPDKITQTTSLVVIPDETEDSPKSWISKIRTLFGGVQSNARDDLNDALAQASNDTSGQITPEQKLMLHNILRLQDVRVEDLMVQRAEIEAVELDTSLGELLNIFEQSGHSRMPVFNETLDDPRGMIHIRDLMGYVTRTSGDNRKKAKNSVKSLDLTKVDLSRELGKLNVMRKIIFVPPSMLAADLMARMQAMRIQIALVIDEYGGTEGLISLEDIVELIVGDIEDEHDDDEVLITKLDNGGLLCDARAEIDDIKEVIGSSFDVREHDEDAETIGGVIFSLLGRVPVKGEVIEDFGFEFRIRDADPRRIKAVEMVPSKITTSVK